MDSHAFGCCPACVKDGKIYGRGSEDNGQSLVASLYAVKALMNLGIRPKRTIILAFVSDEETGSKHGLEWLMKERVMKKLVVSMV